MASLFIGDLALESGMQLRLTLCWLCFHTGTCLSDIFAFTFHLWWTMDFTPELNLKARLQVHTQKRAFFGKKKTFFPGLGSATQIGRISAKTHYMMQNLLLFRFMRSRKSTWISFFEKNLNPDRGILFVLKSVRKDDQNIGFRIGKSQKMNRNQCPDEK